MAESAPPAPTTSTSPASTTPSLADHPTAASQPGRIKLSKILLGLAMVCLVAVLISLAINPHQRQLEAANALRQQQLTELQQALENYAAQHRGNYPTSMGEYWCENCSYQDYKAKGPDQWIPDLVRDGYLPALPTDPAGLQGTVCQPQADNSFAGYVYYSPAPPYNTDYKVFAQCSPPAYALNLGDAAPQSAYCSQRPPYDSTNLSANPFRDVALKPFVDPVRYEYGYAIYSPGLACL